jgi:hypothetical protein
MRSCVAAASCLVRAGNKLAENSRMMMLGRHHSHLHLLDMSGGDPPATCPQLGAEAESSGISSAWSAAALIAAQASSSTVTSQRLAAKEALRSFLKSVANSEWLSLCDEALLWMQGQPSSSSGKNGIVTASCALIEDNTRRCSDATQPPLDTPVSPEQVAAQPAASNPLLSLRIARAVCSCLSSFQHHPACNPISHTLTPSPRSCYPCSRAQMFASGWCSFKYCALIPH